MGKYYGNGGKKVGKVGGEKYYIDKGQNVVQKSNKYYPVNSTLLKREEFKEYVLSLIDEGVPQLYIVPQLPEELYEYALIFVQNEGSTSVYLDKEGIRTHINLEGGGEGEDGVDIVNNVPQNPRNNTIYFVNQPEIKNKDKNVAEYEIYVCDNNVLKKIELKGEIIPELPQIKEVVNDITTKSLKNVYNTNLTADKLLSTDSNGIVTTSDKYTASNPLTMTNNQIGLVKLHNTAFGMNVWKFAFDEYGRVYGANGVDMVQILGRILWDNGSVTIDLPENNLALFFLNTHGGNFFLGQINVNTDPAFRRVERILWNNDNYRLPLVQRISDTRITITATGNCRAVIFTFGTHVT